MSSSPEWKLPESLETLRSRQNPLIRHFRRLDRDRSFRDREGVLLGEGVKVLLVAERQGAEIRTLFVSARLQQNPSAEPLFLRLIKRGVRPFRVTEPLLDYLAGGPGHQGILAVILRPPWREDRFWKPDPEGFYYFLMGIQDPGNIGSTIRVADAVGATGILMNPECADPFGRRAVRASMGSILRVPALQIMKTELTLERLRAAGIRTYATHARTGTSLWKIEWRTPVAVLLGSEGSGLPARLIRKTDASIRIPMRPGVDSLNVAATACLIGYEIYRRRQAAGVIHETP